MPVLSRPLLGSGAESIDDEPSAAKRATRKLRRKNPPPPSLSNHQKLPSAGSSIISLPRSRPTSRSSGNIPFSSWLSRSDKTEKRGSVEVAREQASSFRPSSFPVAPQTNGLGSRAGTSGSEIPTLGSAGGSYRDGGAKPPSPAEPAVATNARPRHTDGQAKSRTLSYPVASAENNRPQLIRPIPLNPAKSGPVKSGPVSSRFHEGTIVTNGVKSPEERSRSGKFAVDDDFLLPPKAPFAATERNPKIEASVEKTDSPILPPLPSFQSGDLDFDASTAAASADPVIIELTERPPKNPARRLRSPHSSAPNSARSSVADTPKEADSPQPSLAFSFSASEKDPEETDENSQTFHALTTEEPVVLDSARSSAQASPEFTGGFEQKDQELSAQQEKKGEEKGSFLGGWKLAVRRSSTSSVSTPRSNSADAPVGVGTGGGWISRRRGSFSSPRPPSAEKANHKSYAQEYREFRKAKAAGKSGGAASSGSGSGSSGASSFDTARGPESIGITKSATAPTIQTPSNATKSGNSGSRWSFMERMKNREAKQQLKKSPAALLSQPIQSLSSTGEPRHPPAALVEAAAQQTDALAEELKRRPISPPDSLKDEKPQPEDPKPKEQKLTEPILTERPPLISRTTESPKPIERPTFSAKITDPESYTSPLKPKDSFTPSPPNGLVSLPAASSSSPTARRHTLQPAPPPGHKSHRQTKSVSPLRNEVGPNSPSPDPKGKGKQKEEVSYGDGSTGPTPRISSDQLGRAPGIGATRPPTPPKPIAKLFIICCRCKYWHDLPSAMYRGMVENGGATRCPYCLHGMETTCCSGYTCVVYMHQRHH